MFATETIVAENWLTQLRSIDRPDELSHPQQRSCLQDHTCPILPVNLPSPISSNLAQSSHYICVSFLPCKPSFPPPFPPTFPPLYFKSAFISISPSVTPQFPRQRSEVVTVPIPHAWYPDRTNSVQPIPTNKNRGG